MADVFSPQKRSEIMSRIRSKGTAAEKIVFTSLRERKIYFQKHYSKVPGKPDIALPRKKKAVFIDGDFWHGRDYERVKQNRNSDDYWVVKIASNIKRDFDQEEKLIAAGWMILRIWESDIKRKSTRNLAIEKIITFLQDNVS